MTELNQSPWEDTHTVSVPVPKILLEPYFDPHTEFECLSPDKTVPEILEWLWGQMTHVGWLDHCEEVDDFEFRIGGIVIHEPWRELCKRQIAAAKAMFFEQMLASLLGNEFWATKRPTPSIAILAELTKHRIHWIAKLAEQNCCFHLSDARTINEIESGRLNLVVLEQYVPDSTEFIKRMLSEFIRIVEPSIELFFASLRAADLLGDPKMPVERKDRTDEPTEEEYRVFRRFELDRRKDPLATRHASRDELATLFRDAGHKASTARIGLMMKRFKNEFPEMFRK